MITGAGAGLGRAMARAAVTRGDAVVAVGRSAASLDETGHDLDPARFMAAPADVRDAPALRRIAADAATRFGAIDALVAGAAIYPRGHVQDDRAAEATDVMAINVVGAANSVAAVLPGMMQRARGRIILVGSFAQLDPLPDSWAYSASKGALTVLARATAAEVRGDYPGILVNEWVPGALNTDMGVPEGHDPAKAALWGLSILDLPDGGPSGRVFNEDRLVELPLSFKRKILRKLRLG
ncbi:NAD(P)-dependent dehydrogenase (short-subunit alcohol dehydrogenase family) [Sphingomonas jejuensis]|uniref:NAD(P)-dependent dehydrogenase (Short-subunit alcohol dehydrogenase family) n=1 Tax=Sphingomonas jejuensis TaxID=904715 RepID=A0ABX0XMK2_9SPHN|nr:SDR family NAD(P)-dependent oxidoreductase [Sphingomonas jejuensis]NJC34608.1 NAD(P)-dependent dehydrogenase (short-subunit alcohol dehydrogenase family) [Sphingomonas jejuensis]